MKVRWVAALAAISASLLAVTILSIPANAAGFGNAFFKSDAALTWCAQESGDKAPVFLDPCNADQPSDLWRGPGPTETGEIVNQHSGLCLTGDNSSHVVDLETCHNRIGQMWTSINGGTFGDQLYQDKSVSGPGFYLWQSVKALQVRAAPDKTSTHDSWFVAPQFG